MASVTYGKCIMANVIMAKIFMAKILWQMKLSRLTRHKPSLGTEKKFDSHKPSLGTE